MNLLLNVYKTNPDADGCEYAFLELTPELCSLILRRAASFENLRASDSSLAEIQYHDYAPVFVERLPDDADEPPYGDDYIETPLTEAELEPYVERTECERMVIDAHKVYWSCIPKHCSYTAETRPVPYDLIRKIAAGEPAPKQEKQA